MYFLKHPSQSIFASQKSNLPITSVFQLQPKSHNHPLPKHTTTANKQCSLFINYGHFGDRPRKELLTIRGVQVMLDRDLAELYGVPTRRLNEQVKRNIRRFPENFMFQLSKTEFEEWRSQNATSNFDSD